MYILNCGTVSCGISLDLFISERRRLKGGPMGTNSTAQPSPRRASLQPQSNFGEACPAHSTGAGTSAVPWVPAGCHCTSVDVSSSHPGAEVVVTELGGCCDAALSVMFLCCRRPGLGLFVLSVRNVELSPRPSLPFPRHGLGIAWSNYFVFNPLACGLSVFVHINVPLSNYFHFFFYWPAFLVYPDLQKVWESSSCFLAGILHLKVEYGGNW